MRVNEYGAAPHIFNEAIENSVDRIIEIKLVNRALDVGDVRASEIFSR